VRLFVRVCTLVDYLAAPLPPPTPTDTPPIDMASPATPRTPSAQTPQLHTPNGTWKHPKFDEITRRQYATTFDERNVRAIVANAGLLFISICANTVASKVKLLGYAV
jgi:nucleoporin POM34